ncbi:MAG: ATP-dependent DNA helicase [Candidatus Nanopelagicales bacterium]
MAGTVIETPEAGPDPQPRRSRVLSADAAAKRALRLLDAVIAARTGAEDRPAQHQMTQLVARATATREPLVVQAGTGIGKSLAYLCGGVGAGARFVVSTATKQLSDQLVEADVPVVADASRAITGRPLVAVALKGRANYLCLAKVDELRALDAQAPPVASDDALDLGIEVPPPLPDPAKPVRPTSADLRDLNELLEWAHNPGTGDRSQAPAAPDRVWWQVSMDSAGCPGARACTFGEECLSEAARIAAREADLVVVNHALLAADLASPNPLFDDRDLIVIDEVHELEGYLSSAWGHEITAGAVERIVAGAARRVPASRQQGNVIAQSILADSAALAGALLEVDSQIVGQRLPASVDGPLASLHQNCAELAAELEAQIKDLGPNVGADAAPLQSARGQLVELAQACEALRTSDPATVRWSSSGRDGGPGMLQAAPLEVGRKFRELIGNRGLIATSATAAVAGDFDPIATVLGLDQAELIGEIDGIGRLITDWQAVDVGTPFDYRAQAILYVPRDFPEPIGKDRIEHTAAVLDELTELVLAAGGRTLALFTTTVAARNAGEHLASRVPMTVLTHGELPAAALAEEFAEDETSVLCATMGMWAGLDIPGPACTLVVIDKIPFAPMNDPLSYARRANADQAGRNGFREVFVNQASLLLTQGAGRLIRTSTDRGVVAILDPRLHSKGYGSIMLRSLPPMWRTDDPDMARQSLKRLAEKSK